VGSLARLNEEKKKASAEKKRLTKKLSRPKLLISALAIKNITEYNDSKIIRQF
jgi:hypothetical protein